MCILGYLCTTFSSNFSFLQSFTIWPINNHMYETLRNRTPLCRIKHAIFRQIIFLLLSATVLYWQGKFSMLEEWWQDDRGVSVCYKLAGFNTAQKSNHLCIASLSEQYNWEPTETNELLQFFRTGFRSNNQEFALMNARKHNILILLDKGFRELMTCNSCAYRTKTQLLTTHRLDCYTAILRYR